MMGYDSAAPRIGATTESTPAKGIIAKKRALMGSPGAKKPRFSGRKMHTPG